MAYIISEDAKDFLQSVKIFCANEIKEQCKAYDVSGEFPHEIFKKIFEIQLHTLEIPEEYGGPGLDRISVAALLEEISKADAGIADTLAGSCLALKPILIAGTEAQKKKYSQMIVDGGFAAFGLTEPMAGSDAGNGKTTAVREGDEYVLNGRKCFITNGGISSFYMITAMTDKSKGVKGISAFVVDAGTPGLSFGLHENKMGLRTCNTCDVVLEDCRIPAGNLLGREGEGFALAMRALDFGRIGVANIAVGIAQRGLDEAIAYGKERIAFGRSILKNQGLQFKIADMQIKIETARQMVAHALTLIDKGLPFTIEAAIAKCYASDIAMEVASEAIQIFGGYGFIKDYPVEKLLRDAKIFQIFEGTNEIQRIVIAGHAIGR